MTQKKCFVCKEVLTKIEVEDFFTESWLGLDAFDLAGNRLGVVDEIIYTGSNDVISIQGDEELLVPVIKEYILKEKNNSLVIKRPELI